MAHEWVFDSGARLTVAAADRLGEDVVRVHAEDTHRILRAAIPTHVPDRTPALAATLRAAAAHRPAAQGTIRFHAAQAARPAWIEAIVYDFDRDPPCDRAVIERALDRIVAIAVERSCAAIALPIDFGCPHGGIGGKEWLEILLASLVECRANAHAPAEIALIVAPPDLAASVRRVATFLNDHCVSSA